MPSGALPDARPAGFAAKAPRANEEVMHMPRYDYRCTACDTVFEIEHGMREHPDVTCPSCGAPATRVFDVSGIVFKGSGFYNTDQRGKKGSTEATSGSSTESTELAKTSNGSKEIKKSEKGETAMAKSSDKPSAPAKTSGAKAE